MLLLLGVGLLLGELLLAVAVALAVLRVFLLAILVIPVLRLLLAHVQLRVYQLLQLFFGDLKRVGVLFVLFLEVGDKQLALLLV